MRSALLTSLLVRPGDRVVVEAPTYPGAIELFSRAGASIVALPATTPARGPTTCAAR